MAFSKAPDFDAITYRQSVWSKALAHPARILILRHLTQHGTTPFATLVRLLPLHRSTVSQHLRQLRQLDVINVIERYPRTYYSINRKVCARLAIETYKLHYQFASHPG